MCLQTPAPPTDCCLTIPAPGPEPLSAGQLRALLRSIIRGAGWGLPALDRELTSWRTNASKIPSPELRRHALSTLDGKRGHAAGAALFAILPPRRNEDLLRLLVAYETIWDLLDTTHEHAPSERNGRQLHLALIDALDPNRPSSDYYLYHPWREDGGYLQALVASCRASLRRLPSHELLRPALVAEAERAQVLALNHEPDPACRDAALRNWSLAHAPEGTGLTWYELSGAASASLTIHALLTLAAEPGRLAGAEIAHVREAYIWISAATTMLDSFVDQLEDTAADNHSYIAHYSTPHAAAVRLGWLIQQSVARGRDLPNGHRHALIVSAMVAMYLSKHSTADPRLRQASRSLARSTGPLTRLLLPILRCWRKAYNQCST